MGVCMRLMHAERASKALHHSPGGGWECRRPGRMRCQASSRGVAVCVRDCGAGVGGGEEERRKSVLAARSWRQEVAMVRKNLHVCIRDSSYTPFARMMGTASSARSRCRRRRQAGKNAGRPSLARPRPISEKVNSRSRPGRRSA